MQEANAIGTAYLRADLIEEPHASRVRRVLAEYVNYRVEESGRLAGGLRPEVATRVAALHERLWNAARDGILARSEMAKAVLDPANEVIDLHSTRFAAGRKHLPILILALLFGCSLLAMAAMGYGAGLGGAAEIAARTLQNPVRQAAASGRTSPQVKKQTPAGAGVMPFSAVACRSVRIG